MKKIIIAILIILVVGAVAFVFIGRTFYPDNIAETSPDGGKKGLRTRIYLTDPVTAAETVKKIIPTLSTYGSSWKLVDESDGGSVKAFKAEVPVVFFTDDLEVKIQKTGKEGEVRVDVRSASRVGKSDLGENARHVRQILGALDRKFQTVPFEK